jgi:hypothetical protein
VLAGLGVGGLTVTVGTPTGLLIVSVVVAWLVDPLLSVALTVMVKMLAVEYV